MRVEAAALQGFVVRLEPLEERHAPGLLAAAQAPDIFKWMSFVLRSADDVGRFIHKTGKLRQEGTGLAFAILSKESGQPIGGTGYWHIESQHRKLEIGGSWLTPSWQRTGANTETKYLLLRHAFEALGCLRVGFVTDELNEKSRAALVRIGAVEEGVLRNHMVQPDGRNRHSVSFSIIAEEWPMVRQRLESKLGRVVAQQPHAADAAAPRG